MSRPGADPEISFGGPRGAEVERRRREDRGAEGWGVGRGLCPSPEFFFQYCIIKWPVLVDSDVLHVLLIVVVKLETCT